MKSLDPFDYPPKTFLDYSREYQEWLAKQKQQGAANEELKQSQQVESQKQAAKSIGYAPY